MSEKIEIGEHDALIVVDVQNCFLPGGSLGVTEGDKVIPVLNRLIPLFKTKVFTQDWHPADHCSFADDPKFVDKSWPVHCVQDTEGADFGPGLTVPDDAIKVKKGTDKDVEAYSGFQDTGLADRLKDLGVKRVFVGGLATDYCVKSTALHAVEHGFEAFVLEDASRAVDPAGTGKEAIEEIRKVGAIVISSDAIG